MVSASSRARSPTASRRKWTLTFSPSFDRVEAALDWFARRGYDVPKLWRGPDGLVRGSAALRTSFGVCSRGLHALTGENVYREPRGVIHCVACRRWRQKYKGGTKSCARCDEQGHNRRTCKNV